MHGLEPFTSCRRRRRVTYHAMAANSQNSIGSVYVYEAEKHTELKSILEIWDVVDIFKKTMLLNLDLCCLSTIY